LFWLILKNIKNANDKQKPLMKEPTTALVTGGGRSIGKETAMNIVICARTQKEIDSVVKGDQIVGK
jgi:hypothetical protein